MAQFLKTEPAQLVILLAVLGVMIAIAVFVIKRFRESVGHDDVSANVLLSNFRDLHSRGTISDEEFRSVKSQLGDKLKEEARAKIEKPAPAERKA